MKQIKKKVLMVLCMAACLFSLTACGTAAKEASGMDPMISEGLQQQTVALLEQIVSIPADQMDLVIEQNRDAGAEAVAAGLEGYVGLLDELGAYQSVSTSAVKEIDDGYEITVNAVFEQRECSLIVGIDEDMVNITTMSFNPVYTVGENMTRAALNTVIGMGTVFIVLIFISWLIDCFKYISIFEQKMKKGGAAAPAAPAPTPAPAAPAPVALTTVAAAGADEEEMEQLAIMTAIIEHTRRNASTDSLVVRPIKRAAGNRWKRS